MAQSQSIDVDFQPDITVEAKPTQELTFYCPLHIVREYDESEYDHDEEVMDEQEEIPSRYAVDCADEINKFIQDYCVEWRVYNRYGSKEISCLFYGIRRYLFR